MPFFSIITVNLNNAKGLDRTLASAQAQDCKDVEHLLIDGASTDGSLLVIEKYKNYLSYAISEKDRGIYQAMNKGIQQAKGKFLLFLNAGDMLCEPTVLSKAKEEMQKFEASIYYANVIFVNDKEKIAYHYKYPHQITPKYFLPRSLCHQTSFIKRELFQQHGLYFEHFRLASDWAFFLKCAVVNEKFRYLPKLNLSYFFLDGLSLDYVSSRQEQKEIISSYFPQLWATYLARTDPANLQMRIRNKLRRLYIGFNAHHKLQYKVVVQQIQDLAK